MKLDFLKLEHKVHLENVLSVGKYINNLLPPVPDKWFTFCYYIHNYKTVSSFAGKSFKPSFRTNSYRKTSVTVIAIYNL